MHVGVEPVHWVLLELVYLYSCTLERCWVVLRAAGMPAAVSTSGASFVARIPVCTQLILGFVASFSSCSLAMHQLWAAFLMVR